MMEPKIRFKGFEGEWLKRTACNIVGRFRTGKLDANAMVSNGKYRFYTCAKDYFHIDTYAFDDEALLISGNGENVGYIHYYNGKFNAYQRTYVLTDFSQNIFFIKSYLEARLKKRINKEKSIGNTPYIRLDTIRDMEIAISPKMEEQQAIASYFTSLDSQISAATSRLAALKQMKAASLQAMFPQEGETVPKIRFKGFEGEWKKVKLGDIAKFTKGQGYSKSDLKETGQPIILYGRMYTKYQFVIDEVDTFANLKAASILSEGDEIIMPASGETPEDIACASAVLAKDIILGGDLNIMHFDLTKISTPYIALVITYSKTHHDLSKCAQGKSVVHLHNGAISRATISLPSLAEQQAIASYFTSLDRQISLQSQRLEKLKQIKSACLDKMFV